MRTDPLYADGVGKVADAIMDLGMPTLIETKTLEECAALCHELGLQFIELNMNLPQYQADGIDVARFAAVAEKYGIYYTIHLDENLNPCDFNERVANAYTETVLQTIEIAKQIGIPVLNMHMAKGVHFTLPERKVCLYEVYKDVYFCGLAEFRNKCTAAIGDTGIRICIENPWQNQFQREGVALLLDSTAFSLTFDIGHNAGVGGIDEPFILNHADRLHHMHIHDYKNGKDHLTFGTGELDLVRYFELAKQHDCRVVLETKTIEGLRQSVKWVKRHE